MPRNSPGRRHEMSKRAAEAKWHKARLRALIVCTFCFVFLIVGAILGDSEAHSNLNTFAICTIGSYVFLCGRTRGPRGPKGDTGPPGPQGAKIGRASCRERV